MAGNGNGLTFSCSCPMCLGRGYTSGGYVTASGGGGGYSGSSGNVVVSGGGGGGYGSVQCPSPPMRGLPGFDPATSERQWDEADFAAGQVLGARWWDWRIPDLQRVNPVDDADVAANWPWSGLMGQTGMLWPDGKLEAGCNQFPVEHQGLIPVAECGCGFWAYWKAQSKSPWWSSSAYRTLVVRGVIEGSGQTLLGDLGFRSQYAEIAALHISAPSLKSFAVNYRSANPRWYQQLEPERLNTLRDAWMAVSEERLAELYPSARIFSTLRAMTAEFPPEPATGP